VSRSRVKLRLLTYIFYPEKYLKKLVGNTEIEDSLGKLDKLTQEEARMAGVEHMRITRSVEGKVMGVDDKLKVVEEGVKDVKSEVGDIRRTVQGVDDKVEDVGKMVQHLEEQVQSAGEKVQDVNDKLDQANRSSFPQYSLFRCLEYPHRKPAPR